MDKAWGEARLQSGLSLTEYTYTGQYSYTGSFGLMYYNARWYDPALGRFAQADSIVPPGVQGLDRYAYVNNSPMNYVDPSGHICVESDGDSDVGMAGNCHGGSNPKYKPGLQGPKWNPNWEDKPTYGDGLIGPPEPPTFGPPVPLDYYDSHPHQPTSNIPNTFNLIESYCGSISTLACLANATQDVATLIDLVGVGLMEFPLVAIGFIEGGPVGIGIAEFEVWKIWNSTLNPIESRASLASLVFTGADDLLNNGGFGENTKTSVTTFIAGALPLTPSWDLVVDGYASGYNHGYFNGASTVFTDGLIK